MEKPIVALTHDDVLNLVIEEAAEVITAAQKCKRFGFDREHPDYGHNGAKLFAEMGDVYAAIEALMSWYPPNRHPELRAAFEEARRTKISRALHAKAELIDEQRQVL